MIWTSFRLASFHPLSESITIDFEFKVGISSTFNLQSKTNCRLFSMFIEQILFMKSEKRNALFHLYSRVFPKFLEKYVNAFLMRLPTTTYRNDIVQLNLGITDTCSHFRLPTHPISEILEGGHIVWLLSCHDNIWRIHFTRFHLKAFITKQFWFSSALYTVKRLFPRKPCSIDLC